MIQHKNNNILIIKCFKTIFKALFDGANVRNKPKGFMTVLFYPMKNVLLHAN